MGALRYFTNTLGDCLLERTLIKKLKKKLATFMQVTFP